MIIFRLFAADGHALIDLLQKVTEPPPEVGQKVLCRHPFQESKRAYVTPTRVESLYKVRSIAFNCDFFQTILIERLFLGLLERWSYKSTVTHFGTNS